MPGAGLWVWLGGHGFLGGSNKTFMAKKLVISSPEFIEGGTIPKKYTADGESVNPPLTIDGVPEGTQ